MPNLEEKTLEDTPALWFDRSGRKLSSHPDGFFFLSTSLSRFTCSLSLVILLSFSGSETSMMETRQAQHEDFVLDLRTCMGQINWTCNVYICVILEKAQSECTCFFGILRGIGW